MNNNNENKVEIKIYVNEGDLAKLVEEHPSVIAVDKMNDFDLRIGEKRRKIARLRYILPNGITLFTSTQRSKYGYASTYLKNMSDMTLQREAVLLIRFCEEWKIPYQIEANVF